MFNNGILILMLVIMVVYFIFDIKTYFTLQKDVELLKRGFKWDRETNELVSPAKKESIFDQITPD